MTFLQLHQDYSLEDIKELIEEFLECPVVAVMGLEFNVDDYDCSEELITNLVDFYEKNILSDMENELPDRFLEFYENVSGEIYDLMEEF